MDRDSENYLTNLKNKLKFEIVVLKNEKRALISKTKDSKMAFLSKLFPAYDKLLTERKVKLLTIKKEEQKEQKTPPEKIPPELAKEIEDLVKRRGGQILSCDFVKGKDGKETAEKIKALGFAKIEDCAMKIENLKVLQNEGLVKICLLSNLPSIESNETQNFLKQKLPTTNSAKTSDQKIIIEILASDPDHYFCGNEIVKCFKRRTKKSLRITGFENILHYMQNIKEVHWSQKGYKLEKEYHHIYVKKDQNLNKNDQNNQNFNKIDQNNQNLDKNSKNGIKNEINNKNNEYFANSEKNENSNKNEKITKKITRNGKNHKIYKKIDEKSQNFSKNGQKNENFENFNLAGEGQKDPRRNKNENKNENKTENKNKNEKMTFSEFASSHSAEEILEAFADLALKGKEAKWAVEIFENSIIDSNLVFLAIQNLEKFDPNSKNFEAHNLILSEMLTSMHKFDFPVTKRTQRNLTPLLRKIDHILPNSTKLAILKCFKLSNLKTEDEKRILIDSVASDSILNWLLINDDKNVLFKKLQRVESILSRSVFIEKIRNSNEIDQIIEIFLPEKIEVELARFSKGENRAQLVLATPFLAEKSIRLLKDAFENFIVLSSKDRICNFYNSSICVKNKRCDLLHICCYCTSEEHSFSECIDWINK